MNDSGQTICLNMIVRNEAPVIRRCLVSLLPIIDYWVVVDTGSTDGTQDVVLGTVLRTCRVSTHHNVPGRTSGTTATEALGYARGNWKLHSRHRCS